jgi:phytoene/squalene synthetase
MRARYADLPPACQDAMWAAQEKYDQFRSICAADLDRWCKGVAPGEGRLIACLRSRPGQLAPLCREMVGP